MGDNFSNAVEAQTFLQQERQYAIMQWIIYLKYR